MDFVPVTYSKEEKRRTRRIILKILGVGAASVIPAPVLIAMDADGIWVFGSFMMATMGVLMPTIWATIIPEEQQAVRREDRAERIRDSINEYYGLNLSSDQFASLSYPEVDPGADFQTFGSIKVQDQVDGVNFIERTIYLTASDGELKLTESRDGKRFKELKPVRRALEGSSAPKALDEAHSSETLETPAVPLSVSA